MQRRLPCRSWSPSTRAGPLSRTQAVPTPWLAGAFRPPPRSRQVAYSGWERSLLPLEWFDSSTERRFANLVDDDDAVELWARFHRDDFVVRHQAGNYHPDFYVRLVDGTHWLVEAKADRDLNTKDVQDKKAAAEKLARFLTDLGDLGTWKYLLVSQSAVDAAKGNWNVLAARTQS